MTTLLLLEGAQTVINLAEKNSQQLLEVASQIENTNK